MHHPGPSHLDLAIDSPSQSFRVPCLPTDSPRVITFLTLAGVLDGDDWLPKGQVIALKHGHALVYVIIIVGLGYAPPYASVPSFPSKSRPVSFQPHTLLLPNYYPLSHPSPPQHTPTHQHTNANITTHHHSHFIFIFPPSTPSHSSPILNFTYLSSSTSFLHYQDPTTHIKPRYSFPGAKSSSPAPSPIKGQT